MWQGLFSGVLGTLSAFPDSLPPGLPIYFAGDGMSEFTIAEPSRRIVYYHRDHIGSANGVTDAQGRLVEENTYFPFGSVRESYVRGYDGDLGDYLFAQKERDKESGLYYFETRYLESRLARFVSVDSLAFFLDETHLRNPQNLNVYAYALNNPIVQHDPTGGAPRKNPYAGFTECWGDFGAVAGSLLGYDYYWPKAKEPGPKNFVDKEGRILGPGFNCATFVDAVVAGWVRHSFAGQIQFEKHIDPETKRNKPYKFEAWGKRDLFDAYGFTRVYGEVDVAVDDVTAGLDKHTVYGLVRRYQGARRHVSLLVYFEGNEQSEAGWYTVESTGGGRGARHVEWSRRAGTGVYRFEPGRRGWTRGKNWTYSVYEVGYLDLPEANEAAPESTAESGGSFWTGVWESISSLLED